ncbi:MAG: PepSY domain-containing protein [Albidovulum sp.]
MKRNFVLTTVVMAIGLVTPGVTFAHSHKEHSGMTEQQLLENVKISKEQATEIATTQFGGTPSSIDLTDENGKMMYEAKMIGRNGGAYMVKIDAQTGAILGKGLALAMGDEGGRTFRSVADDHKHG